MKNPYLRIIGDIHGAISKPRQTIASRAYGRTYLSIVKKCEYSIQLGDMGFDYTPLKNLDNSRHFWIGGNHDNYYTLQHSKIKGYLGDFGFNTQIENFPFFFVRGANSVDKQYRVPGISWWEEEELNHLEGLNCIKTYEQCLPDVVLSHDCPKSILTNMVTNRYKILGSRTNDLLEILLDIHRPKLWIFGHHHKNDFIQLENLRTNFICVQELSFLDVRKDGKIINMIGR